MPFKPTDSLLQEQDDFECLEMETHRIFQEEDDSVFSEDERFLLELYRKFSNSVSIIGYKKPDDIDVESLKESLVHLNKIKLFSVGFIDFFLNRTEDNEKIMLCPVTIAAEINEKWTLHEMYKSAQILYSKLVNRLYDLKNISEKTFVLAESASQNLQSNAAKASSNSAFRMYHAVQFKENESAKGSQTLQEQDEFELLEMQSHHPLQEKDGIEFSEQENLFLALFGKFSESVDFPARKEPDSIDIESLEKLLMLSDKTNLFGIGFIDYFLKKPDLNKNYVLRPTEITAECNEKWTTHRKYIYAQSLLKKLIVNLCNAKNASMMNSQAAVSTSNHLKSTDRGNSQETTPIFFSAELSKTNQRGLVSLISKEKLDTDTQNPSKSMDWRCAEENASEKMPFVAVPAINHFKSIDGNHLQKSTLTFSLAEPSKTNDAGLLGLISTSGLDTRNPSAAELDAPVSLVSFGSCNAFFDSNNLQSNVAKASPDNAFRMFCPLKSKVNQRVEEGGDLKIGSK